MSGDRVEAVAFAIYQEFIRGGVGTSVSPKETPEQACVRRWNRLPPLTRDRFIAEADAALRALEDLA